MNNYYKKICLIKKKDILEKIAIFESEEKKINYKDFIKLINFYAKNLKKLGKHIIVGCMLDNSIEVAALMVAISKLKFSLILLEKEMNNEQLKKCYNETNFDYLILNKKRGTAQKEFIKKTIFIEKISEIKIKKKVNNLHQKFFICSFSSGTTSNPKPIYYSEKCKFWRTKQATNLFNVTKDDKIICYSPIYHSLAQRLTLLAITNFSTLFIMKKFNLFKYIDLIINFKINIIFPISSHLKLIFSELKKKNCNFLKFIVGSSSDLSLAAKKNLYKFFKNKFLELYGLSEAAFVTIINNNDVKRGYIKSVGKACKNVKIKIFNDRGKECKDGEVGEIGCKTQLIFNYNNNQKKILKKITI